MRYSVLWFDDEHENYEIFKNRANNKGIQITAVKNSDEGIQVLKDGDEKFEAILLDGLFYKKEGDNLDDVNNKALGEVMKYLTATKLENYIPCFVYSGQPSIVKESDDIIDLFESEFAGTKKVYDKLEPTDEELLLTDIIETINKIPEKKARMANPEIFEIFEVGYLPIEVEDQVVKLLTDSLPKNKSELKGVLTNIRSVQESCFVKLESIRVIPRLEKFSYKLIHLNGNPDRENRFIPRSTVYQTKEIENLQKWIYFTCGNFIHHLQDQHYNGYLISNYSVQSLISGLMEILLWFKKTYKENI